MKKTVFSILIGICFFGFSCSSIAQNQELTGINNNKQVQPYKSSRDKLKNMSSQEKNDYMQEVKEKWSQLSINERKAFSNKVKAEVAQIKKAMEDRCKEVRAQTNESLTIRLYALELLEAKE